VRATNRPPRRNQCACPRDRVAMAKAACRPSATTRGASLEERMAVRGRASSEQHTHAGHPANAHKKRTGRVPSRTRPVSCSAPTGALRLASAAAAAAGDRRQSGRNEDQEAEDSQHGFELQGERLGRRLVSSGSVREARSQTKIRFAPGAVYAGRGRCGPPPRGAPPCRGESSRPDHCLSNNGFPDSTAGGESTDFVSAVRAPPRRAGAPEDAPQTPAGTLSA
jgi:hypothetical protein